MESCKDGYVYRTKAYVGGKAPNFKGKAYFNQSFTNISLEDYKGKYVVLFFYPLDFTFVCPTEIIQFSEQMAEFKAINCEVVGCSTDSHFSHSEWSKKPREKGGIGELAYPLLADVTKKVALDYGVLVPSGDDEGVAYRGTFIIDGNGTIRHVSINDLPVGRNIDEVIRLVKAFQFTDEHGEVCPSKWKPGGKTMVTDQNNPKTQDYWKHEHSK